MISYLAPVGIEQKNKMIRHDFRQRIENWPNTISINNRNRLNIAL